MLQHSFVILPHCNTSNNRIARFPAKTTDVYHISSNQMFSGCSGALPSTEGLGLRTSGPDPGAAALSVDPAKCHRFLSANHIGVAGGGYWPLTSWTRSCSSLRRHESEHRSYPLSHTFSLNQHRSVFREAGAELAGTVNTAWFLPERRKLRTCIAGCKKRNMDRDTIQYIRTTLLTSCRNFRVACFFFCFASSVGFPAHNVQKGLQAEMDRNVDHSGSVL